MSRGLLLMPAALLLLGAVMPPHGNVTVAVEGLRNHKGRIQACLTADPQTFPECENDPHALRQNVPAAGDGMVHFRDVLPGRYAVAMFHDENSNGRMDKLLIMPREGFAFSRDAPVHMGPPKFDAAAFTLQGSDVITSVHMRYML